jgi:Sulfotransferase family
MHNTSLDREREAGAVPARSKLNEPSPARSTSSVQVVKRKSEFLRTFVRRARRNFVREMWDWAQCSEIVIPSVNQLREAISVLSSPAQVFEEEFPESPIFLLAAGWRSGSTLLQRILVTDPSVLLWGEPFGEMALASGLATLLCRLSTFEGLAELSAEKEGTFSSLPTSWIATLCPPGSDLRSGLRALFDQWLGESTRKRGFKRWGLKEVRLGATEAMLLHWLYPNAKFVLLSRNPYDCYRSLSDSGWHHVYHVRPDVRVDSAAGLARHWNRIALSWSELPSDFPAVRIKYEELISGGVDFRKLESWLGVKIQEDLALSAFVGATSRRHHLSFSERWIISHEAGSGMRALGYR